MITEKIKTFEDALAAIGESEASFNSRTANDAPDEIAYKQLKVIALALNEGWKPNWKDDREYKYYPWFDMEDDNGSGLGLSYGGCVCDRSFASVGSRLCFKSREIAIYAGEQFVAIYAAMMVITEV